MTCDFNNQKIFLICLAGHEAAFVEFLTKENLREKFEELYLEKYESGSHATRIKILARCPFIKYRTI